MDCITSNVRGSISHSGWVYITFWVGLYHILGGSISHSGWVYITFWVQAYNDDWAARKCCGWFYSRQ